MLIKQAVLHILDKGNQNLLLSDQYMEIIDGTVSDYLNRLIEKVEKSEIKTGNIQQDNDELAQKIQPTMDLLRFSRELATECFEIMTRSENMSPADYLFFVGRDDCEHYYFGMIRLDYHVYYTHHLEVQEGIRNQLIAHQAIFPSPVQSPSEAFICNMTTGAYQLLEKSYLIEGEKRCYLASDILKLIPTPTAGKQIKQIRKTVQSISKRFDEPAYERMSQAQKEIYEQLDDNEGIDANKVIEEVFRENTGALMAAKEEIRSLEVPERIHVSNLNKYEQKYRKQKYRLSNGIEISIPMELYNNQEIVEFINEPNGTISVVIKNIDAIQSRFQ